MRAGHRRRWLNIAMALIAPLALGVVAVSRPAVLAAAALSGEGQAARHTTPTPCFLRRDWTGSWKVARDSRTIYINVAGSIYRLDLAQAYPLLKSPWAVLHDTDASDAICSAIDFRLSVSDQIGNWQTPIVRKMTRLSAAQAAALPRKLRP
jgi:hypothetical protein